MTELEERLEILSQHVALLEGVLDAILRQVEAGTLQETAASIRATLPKIEY